MNYIINLTTFPMGKREEGKRGRGEEVEEVEEVEAVEEVEWMLSSPKYHRGWTHLKSWSMGRLGGGDIVFINVPLSLASLRELKFFFQTHNICILHIEE